MLFDKLNENAQSGILPMHMPGHKRNIVLLGNALPYELDITEINGFDDLHDMNGMLLEIAETAASLYGASSAFPMVNGTTSGILAAVRAACFASGKQGGSIIMSRFSHKSVYNAAELCTLTPVYLMPKHGMEHISADDVKQALENTPDAKCVILTSPTYEGVVSDIGSIAEAAHSHRIPLIVDAAHGAHFGLSEHFPKNAVRLGADIEIVSLHKTLPSLTQSSLALIGKDSLIAQGELKRQLRVFETSSPSYILLASIEKCLKLIRDEGDRLFDLYAENLLFFRERTQKMVHLKINKQQRNTGYDSGKIVICTTNTNITGIKLQTLLREKHCIELEMATAEYALAMTSICDTRESFERLAGALIEIDEYLEFSNSIEAVPYTIPKRKTEPWERYRSRGEQVLINAAVGKIALEYVWAYPPGIPILVPGEIIDSAVVQYIQKQKSSGVDLHSDYGLLPEIMCACE